MSAKLTALASDPSPARTDLIYIVHAGVSYSITPAALFALLNSADISAAGGAAGANPSASVGLTAVNGVATTFLRSDGSPALDATIAPTWTGLHTFQPAGNAPATSKFLAASASLNY